MEDIINMSICAWCGKEYKRRSDARTDTCGKKCTKRQLYDTRCKLCGERIIGEICYGGDHYAYCSEECYNQDNIRICLECGTLFVGPHNILFCNNKCQYAYHAEESNRKKREAYEWISKDQIRYCLSCGGEMLLTEVQAANGERWLNCRKCGEDITKNRTNILRRIRSKEAYVENVLYAVIWKRDKGICQICGRRCHKRWNAYDPLSGTRDHIIALANGGEHSYDNVQLACRDCNSRKRDLKDWIQPLLMSNKLYNGIEV